MAFIKLLWVEADINEGTVHLEMLYCCCINISQPTNNGLDGTMFYLTVRAMYLYGEADSCQTALVPAEE